MSIFEPFSTVRLLPFAQLVQLVLSIDLEDPNALVFAGDANQVLSII